MTFTEFWQLTPADVLLAVDAHERRERSAYWRAGLITAAIVNSHKTTGRRVKPEDFVPGPRRRKPQTPVQMANALKALTMIMGGQVIDTTAGGSRA